jgi:hypothetical protein
MDVKAKIIFTIFILSLPMAGTLIDFRFTVSVFDNILSFIGLDVRDTHLSLGAYFLIAYILLYTLLAIPIIEFMGLKECVAQPWRIIIWICLLAVAILSWNVYML